AGAPAVLAAHRRPLTVGCHVPGHHPLPRRGRTVPSRRPDPRWCARGHRHHGGGQADIRRQINRGSPHRRPGPRDEGARGDARRREDEPVRNGRARGVQATPARHGSAGADARVGGDQGRECRAGLSLARRRLPRRRREGRAGVVAGMGGVLAVYRKELRQIARDRRTLMILAFIPAFFLLLYGYALNFDIRNIRLAVEDRDGTAESRALVSAFVNSGYFDLAGAVYSPADAERLLDLNAARAVLVVPQGFSRDVTGGRTASIQVIINGDNANTATTVMGYALSIVRETSGPLSGRVQVAAPVMVEPRIWYNPELRSTLFLVPGLIAYIAMITAVA